MASRSLGTLTVDLIAKIGGFVSGMNQAEKVADKKAKAIEKRNALMAKRLDDNFKKLGAAVVGYFSFQAVKQAFDQVVSAGLEYGDRIDEIANRLQISAEKFQEITFAAKFTGVSEEDIQNGLARLAKGINEAQVEGSRMAQLFDAMGVSTKNADGSLRETAATLRDVQDFFKQSSDATGEMALAMELFGKSGVKFMEFLNLGSQGMDEFAQRARDMGLILSNETVANVAAFQDNLDQLKLVMSVVGAEIVSTLLPAVVELGNWVVKLTAEYRENGGQAGALADVIDFLSGSLKLAMGFAKAAGNAFDGFKLIVGQAINAILVVIDQFVNNVRTAIEVVSSLMSLDISGAMNAANRGISTYFENFKKGAAGAQASWDEFSGKAIISSAQTAKKVNANLQTIGNFTPVPGAFSGQNPWAKAVPQQVQASEVLGKVNAPKAPTPKPARVGGGGGARSSGGGGGGKSEAQQAIEEAKRAQEQLNDMFADAMLGYEQTLFMLGKEGEASRALWETEKGRYSELNPLQKQELIAKAQLVDLKQKEAEAQENFKRLTEDNAQYLSDLEFQATLIGKSREEQELMNLARQLELELQAQSLGMTQQQIEALRAQNAEIVKTTATNQTLESSMRGQIQVMDSIRSNFSGALTDWLSGTKSFKDAFLGALDSINQRILQMISDKLMEKLFGGMGTGGGGLFGGMFSGLFSGLGGNANGGHVSADSFQRVNERGPELLTTTGGKQYLMMGDNSGTVTPNHMSKKSGIQQTNNFVIQGRIDRRTQLQIAQEAGRRANAASSRS